MKPENDRLERLLLTARRVTQRVSLLFLLTLAGGLLLLGRAESVLIERLALSISNTVAPALDAMTQSAGGVRRGLETLHHFLFVFDENARLRAEVEQLRGWQAAVHRLDVENRSFRQLLRVQPEGAVSFVTGRAIGEASGPFVRTILVDAGREARIDRNEAVLTADGLAGRVVSVGRHAARVLLITDINSRIPVLLEHGRQHGMLSGDNSGRPILEFLPPGTKPAPGERVVTSGDGGMFPVGLPVGVVVRANDSEIRVQPFVDFDRLDYVQIARFDLPLDADDKPAEPSSASAGDGKPGASAPAAARPMAARPGGGRRTAEDARRWPVRWAVP